MHVHASRSCINLSQAAMERGGAMHARMLLSARSMYASSITYTQKRRASPTSSESHDLTTNMYYVTICIDLADKLSNNCMCLSCSVPLGALTCPYIRHVSVPLPIPSKNEHRHNVKVGSTTFLKGMWTRTPFACRWPPAVGL
jgi:hypothetical protein